MPTYDYVCDACEHAFEEFQSISAKTLKKCPECKKPKLRRLIGTGSGVIFKGSGFYETDYRSDSYNKDAKADKDAGKSPENKESNADNGSEAKPATKTDSPKESKPDATKKTNTKKAD